MNGPVTRSPVLRGWRVENHAVDQFVKRVLGRAALGADLTQTEVATWLREHAHQATHTGEVTRKGNPVYRLAHPWPGPDAALIVKHDPGGVIAAVTCAWWEELDELDAPATRLPKPVPEVVHRRPTPQAPTMMAVPDRPLSAEEIRAGLARAARKGSTLPPKPKPAPKAIKPPPIEPPPHLPCPPGNTQLAFLGGDLSLDLARLTSAELRAWGDWLRVVAAELTNRGQCPASQKAATLRKHCYVLADVMARKTASPFLPEPDAPKVARESYNRALVDALGVVLTEEVGEVETSRLFSLAKERAWAALTKEAAE
jgi:hypothetical protein